MSRLSLPIDEATSPKRKSLLENLKKPHPSDPPLTAVTVPRLQTWNLRRLGCVGHRMKVHPAGNVALTGKLDIPFTAGTDEIVIYLFFGKAID